MLKKYSHSWSLINCSQYFFLLYQSTHQGIASGGQGLMIAETLLSIKKFKRRVGLVKKNLSWKLSWILCFKSPYNVHSSIDYSSKNLSTIFFTHSNRFVWLSLFIFLINNQLSWSLSLVMNDYQEFFLFQKGWFQGRFLGISHETRWKIYLFLVQELDFFF